MALVALRLVSALLLLRLLAGIIVSMNLIKIAKSACCLAVACAGLASAQEGPQPKLPVTELTLGIHRIQAEVAQTPAQQAIGMMFRREMGTNEAMLFVNEDAGQRCFWMRNTLLPLSIAFIADDGSIVNIAEMPPQSDQSHCSAKPVRYALEMNRGWFSKRGFKAGDRLRGGPFGK